MEWLDLIAQVSGSAIRLSVPLLFACLAGLYSERSGVFDIGLEGKMLVAAFASGAVAATTGSAWIGLLAAIAASVAFSLIHGFASITHRGNQIVSGVAINFIALGLTAQLGETWFKLGGQTPQLPNTARFLGIAFPFADTLRGVPVIGQIYSQILSGHNILVYLAFLAVPLTWWILYRTRFGLRLRAVGENPAAVDTAGISVAGLRYSAVICCGVLCGFAGAYLAIAQSAGFIEYMTAGKGFIALAALIFAKWRPVPAMWACLLFGLLEAVAIRLQGVPISGIGIVPVQLMQAVPYILTVILLAGFIGHAAAPRAGGVAYVKEK
jgi:general nucleoside transport system permease protein